METLSLFAQPTQLDTNTPNAGKLIDSLRHVGYDNYFAVADLVDNSIDADAHTIRIDIRKKGDDFIIQIADDGKGMDVAVLDQALRLGSETDRDQASDLGRFGMGLITAALSIGRRLEVYTRGEGSEPLYAAHDVDDIKATNSFVRELRAARPDEIAYLDAAVGDGPGTVIAISKTDLLSNRTSTHFAGTLKKRLAQTFRYFLEPDVRTMSVNGEEVLAFDPLRLGDPNTEIYSEESYTVRYADHDGNQREGDIKVRVVVLPEAGKELQEQEGVNLRNQGFYILRNQREIKAGETLDLYAKHNDLNRFRAELSFSGDLDDAMGVNFAKREISPIQPIMDKLRQEIRPQIYSIKNRVSRARRVEANGDVSHDEAQKVIRGKAKLLIKPPVEKELRPGKPERTGQTPEAADVPKKTRSKFTNSETIVSDRFNVRFDTARIGREGPIYSAAQEGRTTVIQWNIDHPFYERFVLEHKDNPNLVTSADFLVYSMAAAELRLQGDDEGEWMATLKSTISTNLRVLLS